MRVPCPKDCLDGFVDDASGSGREISSRRPNKGTQIEGTRKINILIDVGSKKKIGGKLSLWGHVCKMSALKPWV